MKKEVYEYIAKASNDPIIQRRLCTISGEEFAIFQSDVDFYNKFSPTFAGKKYNVPLPDICPEERQRRRQMFRNERNIYRRTCSASEKSIISVYSPDSPTNSDGNPFKVYDQEIWRSDRWDPLQYGRDFDFSRTLFDQFKDLQYDVPHLYLVNINVENSYYTNFALYQKNCYLIFWWANNEDCWYSAFLVGSNNCIDTHSCTNCEFCYEAVDCAWCYNCYFVKNCKDCTDCTMTQDCINCRHCIWCFGLANQEYYFLNKKYSKEEFKAIEEEYKNLDIIKIKFLKEQSTTLANNLPHRYAYIYDSENSIGNIVRNSKNTVIAFDATGNEDCKYIYSCPNSIRSQDCVFNAPEWNKNCYNVCSSVGADSSMSTYLVRYGSYMYYCMECFHCNNCFSCIWLKNKEYCIFNKQYTREEYEKLVAQIIEKMIGDWQRWLYFDPSLSPFGYNETVVMEYFPLSREQAMGRGYKWQDKSYETTAPQWTTTLKWDQIPEDITTVTDDILRQIFICEVSGRPYKITKQELDFYRKHGLPLPRKHHDIRHQERFTQRPERMLHVRKCDKCSEELLSIYDEKVGFKVYCEACYNKEVYG